MPSVSIIICTQNRAADLRRSLAILGQCRIPTDWEVEMIVVDNASTDETPGVVKAAAKDNPLFSYLFEAKKGLSHARNAGLAGAGGDIILFTDDDVHVAEDWIEQMGSPLIKGESDAVCGLVTLAPNLLRSWMGTMHKGWLASSIEAQPGEGPKVLVGASMGLRRAVLQKVPRFDPELGAGALGSAEDTLFGWQLAEAGFRINHVPKARGIHHLDASRLKRKYWLGDARKRGHTKAYLFHHWEHSDIAAPKFEWLSYWARLHSRRLLQPPPDMDAEGCPPWEMSYVLNMEKCKQFCLERHRERNYSRHGLEKRK